MSKSKNNVVDPVAIPMLLAQMARWLFSPTALRKRCRGQRLVWKPLKTFNTHLQNCFEIIKDNTPDNESDKAH